MTYQTITLNVPETVYQQIRRAVEKIRRPLNDILAGIPSMKRGGEVADRTLAGGLRLPSSVTHGGR